MYVLPLVFDLDHDLNVFEFVTNHSLLFLTSILVFFNLPLTYMLLQRLLFFFEISLILVQL